MAYEDSHNSDESYYLSAVELSEKQPWKAKIGMEDREMNLTLDTRADVTINGASLYQRIGPSLLEAENKKLFGPRGVKAR